MVNSFYSDEELLSLGFKSFGRNVLISHNARFYGIEQMEIGDSVRIDDFCILSGKIKLGSFIHVSAYSALYGRFGIVMEDYSGLSPRCTIFSASDDFNGNHLIGPMVDTKLTHVIGGQVKIARYSQVGSGCIVLPGVSIGEGVAVGAMSLVNDDLNPWSIYYGIPARFIKNREKGLLNLV